MPQLADDLRVGVEIFDEVWYGDRPGSMEAYARLKQLDERLQAARPKPLRSDGDPALAGAGTGPHDGEDGGPRW